MVSQAWISYLISASKGKTTANWGVSVKGDGITDYYGILIYIVELQYIGTDFRSLKIVLFKCEWFDSISGLSVHPSYELVDIDRLTAEAMEETFQEDLNGSPSILEPLEEVEYDNGSKARIPLIECRFERVEWMSYELQMELLEKQCTSDDFISKSDIALQNRAKGNTTHSGQCPICRHRKENFKCLSRKWMSFLIPRLRSSSFRPLQIGLSWRFPGLTRGGCMALASLRANCTLGPCSALHPELILCILEGCWRIIMN
ncbi:hypothetical protein AKJ16_DCAP14970 [Drosera capensis]